jgi:glycosyltransferase involved in cell wall biosynthesis
MFPSGAVVANLGMRLQIPSIVAVGESTEEELIERDRLLRRKWDIRHITGVIAVSRVNKERCVAELSLADDKILLSPNGADLSLFHPRDRMLMRAKYGLPACKKILAFTGHFNHIKGPNRVLEAIKGMDNVGVVLIGEGAMNLTDSKILFKAVLEHEKVPELLSAADIFVLPTRSEGSCNAILEALACGLPVVTSIHKFNDDIVDDNVCIRINPENIGEIRESILRLSTDNALCVEMSQKALARIERFDINLRAKNVIDWIYKLKENYAPAVPN